MKKYAVTLIACMVLAGCGTSREAVRPSPVIAEAIAAANAAKQKRAEAGQEMQDQQNLDEYDREPENLAIRAARWSTWWVLPLLLGWSVSLL